MFYATFILFYFILSHYLVRTSELQDTCSLFHVYSISSYMWADAFTQSISPDHQTGQFLSHSLVLNGVYKRVHADIEVRQEQGGVVAVNNRYLDFRLRS